MVAPVPAQISKLPCRKLSCSSRRSGPNSRPVNLLQALSSLCAAPVLCFQQLAASFPKTPGWGVPLRNLRDLCASPSGRRVSALSFVFALVRSSWRFLCPPLSTFRMNTCKSVSKQSTLTTFRMNTYAKQGEGGGVVDLVFSTLRSLFRSQRSLCCAFSASASDKRREQSCRISRSHAGRFGFCGCGWSVGIRPVRCRNTAAECL